MQVGISTQQEDRAKGEVMKRILAILAAIGVSSICFGGPAPKTSPQLTEKGKAAYKINCASCHGDHGDGKGPAGAALNPPPRNLAEVATFVQGSSREKVFDTITKGVPGKAMVAFGHLSEEDRWGLTDYVLEFSKKKNTAAAPTGEKKKQ